MKAIRVSVHEVKGAIIGCLFGGIILHPLVMVVAYVNNYFNVEVSITGINILSAIFIAFSFKMLPMTIIYVAMCGTVGYVYAKKQRAISLLLKRLNEFNFSLNERVKKRTEELSLMEKISIIAFGDLAEYHDQNTGEHNQRIGEYVRLLIDGLKKNGHYLEYASRPGYEEELVKAAPLHDIGKVVVPEAILKKPGKLEPWEFDIIKTHTTVAGAILKKANETFRKCFDHDSYLALARDIAFGHHEKWNGKGYPSGLSGNDIPLSARIVALADVFDALTEERPYKKPWSFEKVLEEITKCADSHFDPLVVEAFLLKKEEFKRIALSYR